MLNVVSFLSNVAGGSWPARPLSLRHQRRHFSRRELAMTVPLTTLQGAGKEGRLGKLQAGT
jgi:hypothetical protein